MTWETGSINTGYLKNKPRPSPFAAILAGQKVLLQIYGMPFRIMSTLWLKRNERFKNTRKITKPRR